jgi:hypothetical protein
MTRRLIFAALLASGIALPTALLAAGGPPIAYAKIEGGGTNVYLTNANGTGTVKLYTTPKKHTVSSLDLKPGGNEIAVIEYNGTLPTKLKIISFNDNGVASQNVRTLNNGPCSPLSVDYHPTQPLLLLLDVCSGQNRIATINTDGTGYAVLHPGSSTSSYRTPRWLANGTSHVYVRSSEQNPNGSVCVDDCATPLSAGTVVYLDVARSSNKVLVGSHGYVSELNLDNGSLTSNFITGTDGHYSPDDSQVLFESQHDARGDYLHVWNSNGTTPRITGKGEYGAKDWRN